MKAAEVLRLYEAGERDFKGVNLRGENFKGKDLAGADFGGADIRSTKFTNANLTGASFTRAKAGVRKLWAVGSTIVSVLLSILSGFFSSLVGYLVSQIFSSNNASSLQYYRVTGSVALAVIVVSLFVLLRKGVFASVFAVAGALAIAIALAVTGAFAGSATASGDLAVTIATSLVMSGALTLVVTTLGSLAFLLSGALVVAIVGVSAVIGSIIGTVAVAGAAAGAISGIVSAVLMLASAYAGWRAMMGDKRDAWVRSSAIAFLAIGGTSFREAILTDADFSWACLTRTDFRQSVLLRTFFRNTEKLDRVRPGETYLANSKIRKLVSTCNGQGQSYDHLLNLVGLNLTSANLDQADFTGSTLKTGTLQGAALTNAYFIRTDLNRVNLRSADLSYAQLVQTQLDQADLTGATLTGACIEDWNVNASTKLTGVNCDYIYLKSTQRERRPSQGVFKPGEFAALFQQAVNTVDLIFKDGIDWQAFFQSFQDLRTQYADEEFSIQAIEKKKDDAFIVRIEVTEGADKSVIESSAKELYETKLVSTEQRYRDVLEVKNDEIIAYKEKSTDLMKIAELLGSKIMPSEINQTFNAPVANAAGINYGNMSAIQNNYGSNAEDLTRLLTALRDQAQSFPTDQKDDANDALDLLERDLADEQPDQGRIGRRLKKLAAIATTLTIGATAFTADLAQLADVLNVPLPQVEQLQPELPPPSH